MSSTTEPNRSAHLSLATGRTGLLVVAGVVLLAVVAPEPIPLASARLASLAAAVTGTWLLVGRGGVVDLASASVLAMGSVAGGVGSALLELPAMVGVPVGAVTGGAIAAVAGAVHGRVGRTPGALASLALGLAVVAVLAAWPPLGGAGGFHAVGLPAPGGARIELVAVGSVTLVVLGSVGMLARSRWVGVASTAVRAPELAAASGHAPALAVARLGAAAGAALGSGGALLAAVEGSVVPGAYGLDLTAALVLAAMLGGAPPIGPVIGVLLVWGPSTVLPLVPLIGTSPPLLVMGPVGLGLLLWRGGRPAVATPLTAHAAAPTPSVAPVPDERRRTVRLRELATPSGPVSGEVRPGEILAVVGPNGAGKSTLLARIGGQLPDDGGVELDGAPAPRGAVRRARAGIARTWQIPPSVPPRDMAALRARDPDSRAAAVWAESVLGPAGGTGGDPGREQLLHLVASRPVVALIDEPTSVAPEVLATLLRGLADAGTAVLLVDHRPEVVALANRRIVLGAEQIA